MPPTSCEPQPSRVLTAAELNEQIREFMRARTGRPLWQHEAAEYERLLEQWAAAVRAEIVAAA